MAKRVVKEFVLEDGVGAQFYRKIYAMCYAKENNIPFFNRKIKDFFIHESDNIRDEFDEKRVLDFFNNLLINPWENEDFSGELEACPGIGETLPETMGQLIDTLPEFTKHGPSLNPITTTKNSIAIHIRRGNVIPGNPRWIDDEVYVRILKNLYLIIDDLNLIDPEIIIVTDSPDEEKMYKPINRHQADKWNQDHLIKSGDGSFVTKTIEFDRYRAIYPNIKFVNRVNPEDAFLELLQARVLLVSPSVFSQCAGLLSKNTVIDVLGRKTRFAGSYGNFDELGRFHKYDPFY